MTIARWINLGLMLSFYLLNSDTVDNQITVQMRNSTKLKNLLQPYTIRLDMDDDESIHLTLMNKRTGATETFIHGTYTRVLEQAFVHMKKGLKKENQSEG